MIKHMKIYIAHSASFDFVRELYDPIKQSALWKQHQFTLPHEGQRQETKAVIKQSDLVVAEISYPSTGEGIELGWADISGTPIACLYRKGSQYSGSIRFVSHQLKEYTDANDVIAALTELLSNHIGQQT
jgi:hypothetical protein